MSHNNQFNHGYYPYVYRQNENSAGYYRTMGQYPIQPPQQVAPQPPPPQVSAVPAALATTHQHPPQMFYQPYSRQPYYTYVQPLGGEALISPRRRKTKHFSTWTPSEDKLLRELKEGQKMGWKQILAYFNDRTPNACQFRWRRVVGSANAARSSIGLMPESPPAETGVEPPQATPSKPEPHTHLNSSNTTPIMTSPANSTSQISQEELSPVEREDKESHHSINFLLN